MKRNNLITCSISESFFTGRSLSFLHTLLAPLLFTLLACEQIKEPPLPPTLARATVLMDSMGRANILACFAEEGGISILARNQLTHKAARKFLYRTGYPVFTDSLVCVKYDEFKSPRFTTTYLIKDSSVLTIRFVKIIHPSSNWQGQTPWTQPYVNTYKRMDLNPN